MATPKLITVTGPVTGPDGLPAADARVTFTTTTLPLDAVSGGFMMPSPIEAVSDAAGLVELQVPATDDPSFSPTGWTWLMTITGDNGSFYRAWPVAVPFASPDDTVQLAELVPAPPSGSAQLYATLAALQQYVSTDELDDAVEASLAGTLDAAINAALATALSGYATTGALAAYVDTTELATALSGYATTATLAGYATTAALAGYIDPTELATALSPYITSATAASTYLPKLAGEVIDSTFVIRKGDSSSGIRMRSTGGAVDYDKMNGDIVISSFAGPGFTGAQTNLQLWRNNGSTFVGDTHFGSTAYASEQYVNASTGVSRFGAKNGLGGGWQIAAYKDSAGAPTTGTWAAQDLVLDSNNRIWRCTVSGTPGTWVGLLDQVSNTRAPVILTWNGSSYVATPTANIYVGPDDPGSVPDGSLWVDTTP